MSSNRNDEVDICLVCDSVIPTGEVDAALHLKGSVKIVGWSCSEKCSDAWDGVMSAAGLPVDLDGDPYRNNDILGPWKVTACCGAFAKGTEDGIVCRSCFAYLDDHDDAPARLSDNTTRA